MSQIISNEDFLKKLDKVNSGLIPLEEYKGCSTPILFKCKFCGLEQMRKPSSLTVSKQKCTACTEKQRIKHLHFTDEKFREKLKLKNPNMEAVEDYIDMITPISFRCLKCGNIEKHDPHSILKSKVGGCKNCRKIALSKSRSLTDEYFKEAVYKKNPSIKILSNYNGGCSRINCCCLLCNNHWITSAQSLLSGTGCPVCGYVKNGLMRRKTNEQFVEELFSVNPRIRPLSNYTRSKDKVKCLCLICLNEFFATAGNLLSGSDCPNCDMPKGERIVSSWLKANGINTEQQVTFKDLLGLKDGHLSYDFYIKQYNLLIEYQGQQHYYPVDVFGGKKQFEVQQEHDKRKKEYAEKHGINLLCIRYDENVEEVLSLWFRNNRPKPWVKIKYISKLESVETAGQSWQQAC